MKLEFLLNRGVSCKSDDNISNELRVIDIKAMENNVTDIIEKLLDALLIDWRNDDNTENTPRRVAKALIHEQLSGRYTEMPEATTFNNTAGDEVFTIGPISFTSMCSHHFVLIQGTAFVAVHPDKKLLGLSKYSRLIQWVMSRPTVQEMATQRVADVLEKVLSPLGLMVVIKAKHHCCSSRGVKDKDICFTTSVLRGSFKQSPSMKMEILELIK